MNIDKSEKVEQTATGGQIFKFGGASIWDASSIRKLTDLLRTFKGNRLLLVISALGKTTNALEGVLQHYLAGDTELASQAFNQIKEHHLGICRNLIRDEANPIWADLSELFVEVEWLLEDELHDSHEYLYDQIVCIGELLSTRIVTTYLNQEGLPVRWADARGLLITDDNYSAASPNLVASRARMQELSWDARGEWLVVQGFIGGTEDNNSTTLGREGSDYSAVLFAVLTGAKEVTLWKDVAGLYTADPKSDPHAQILATLTYQEAHDVLGSAETILHSSALILAQEKSITIRIRSFLNAEAAGTIIHA